MAMNFSRESGSRYCSYPSLRTTKTCLFGSEQPAAFWSHGHGLLDHRKELHRGTGYSGNDSTILSGTYVGVCLDLAHAVVHQNCLMDVQRNVGIEMADSLIGATSASRRNLVPGLWATVASMSVRLAAWRAQQSSKPVTQE